MQPDQIGIAIVAFNTKRFWPRQREALARQTHPPFRILVVDNASDLDERLSPADLPPNAELLQLEKNIGFAAANNLACARLNTPIFVTLNPDAFPTPTWLERLTEAAERNPDAAAIGSLQLRDGAPDVVDGAGDVYWAPGIPYRALYGKKLRPLPAETETFSVCAAAALYRRDAVLTIGGFDESFFCYCEDVDLGFRLRLDGWRAVQANDAIVFHIGGGSSAQRSAFGLRLGARNRLWTYIKNMPGPLLWLLAPAHLFATLSLLAMHTARGELLPVWQGLSEAIADLPRIRAARREIQATRKAPIARALSWSPTALLTRAPAPPFRT